jgi:hypothetical protein
MKSGDELLRKAKIGVIGKMGILQWLGNAKIIEIIFATNLGSPR